MSLSLIVAAAAALACPPGFRGAGARGLCAHDSPYVTTAPGDGDLGHRLVPDKAALDPKAVALGRLLFFDPILSRDGDLSCGHCHDPRRGLGDAHAVSLGHRQRALARNAPSLWNVTFKRRFFWDGRAKTLEEQALGPLYHPDELGNAPGEAAQRVAANPDYAALFAAVYGPRGIDDRLLTEALADFERSLVSLGSRYDHYALGDHRALSAKELRGYNVFRSFVSRCPECHTPPLFTNGQLAAIGAPSHDGDRTRAFLVPSLRNVASTSPYMHDGGLATLTEVLDFYDQGGGRGVSGVDVKRLHWHIRPLGLSDDERAAVVLFLGTLTDERAMPAVPAQVPSGLPVLK
jgi:cytochrome c peroxidase